MDHVADLNLSVLHRINQQHDLPDFVKQATINRDAVQQLPSSSFADIKHRRFPCHTGADTVLSYVYFLKHASDLDGSTRDLTQQRLQDFAHHWSVVGECEKALREHEKQASADVGSLPDRHFAIVEEWEGQHYRALPLLDERCIKSAAEHIYAYRDRYPMQWRRHAAARILDAARDRDVETPHTDYLEKAAGGISSHPDIAKAMLGRAILIDRKHRGSAEQIGLLKAAKAMSVVVAPDAARHAAEVIDAFDQQFDLTRLYARGLPTPEEICFGAATHKQAASIRDNCIRLTNGTVYTKAALVQEGLAPYRVLGDDFVNEIRSGLDGVDIDKVASIVPTLPRDDANLLDRALRGLNVKSATALLNGVNDTFGKLLGEKTDVRQWSNADWNRIQDAIGA